MDEVFEQLRTTRRGLSSEDAAAREKIFGPNMLEEKPVSTTFFKISKLYKRMISFRSNLKGQLHWKSDQQSQPAWLLTKTYLYI